MSVGLIRLIFASIWIISSLSRSMNDRRRGLILPNILNITEKQSILDQHNEWRRRVALGQSNSYPSGTHPIASNMNSLIWVCKYIYIYIYI